MISIHPPVRRGTAGLAPVLTLTLLAGARQAGAQAVPTAFVHVSVIPMDRERVMPDQTVVVQGDRIVALGPAQRVRVPANAVQVDGRGKFLIPGLADMHAHLGILGRIYLLSDSFLAGVDPSVRFHLKEQQLFLWLAHGLTTVRNMDHNAPLLDGDWAGDEVLRLRARAAAGTILSPRIYTAGNLLGRLGPEREQVKQSLQLDEVVEAVRRYKAAGFDFIKVHGNGVSVPDPVFDSLAATARRVGLPVVGHTVVPLDRALATYRSIEHLGGYVGHWGYDPVLRVPDSMSGLDTLAPKIHELAMATRKAGVWNCPTLDNSRRNMEGAVDLALRRRLVKALQDAGAGLLAGSDRLQFVRWHDPNAMTILRQMTPTERKLQAAYGDPDATHRELEAFVEAGLTPYQALATATWNPAKYFGTLASTGTIAVGKRADLVLLHGNPLADIRQTQQIAGVMHDGRWLARAEIDRRTAELSFGLEQVCAAASADGRTPCRDPLRLYPAAVDDSASSSSDRGQAPRSP